MTLLTILVFKGRFNNITYPPCAGVLLEEEDLFHNLV